MKKNVKSTSKNTGSTSSMPRKSGKVLSSERKSAAAPKKGGSSSSVESATVSSPSPTRNAKATRGSSLRGRRTGKREKLTRTTLGEFSGPDRSDWARVDAMTDEDIQRAIASD